MLSGILGGSIAAVRAAAQLSPLRAGYIRSDAQFSWPYSGLRRGAVARSCLRACRRAQSRRASAAPALAACALRSTRGCRAAGGCERRLRRRSDHRTDAVLAGRRHAPGCPASVEKLYTTSTALLRFGPNARLHTSVSGAARWIVATESGTARCICAAAATRHSARPASTAPSTATGATDAASWSPTCPPRPGSASIHGRDRRRRVVFRLAARHPGEPATRPTTYIEGELSALAYDRGFADLGRAPRSRPVRRCSRPSSSPARSARGRQRAESDPHLHRTSRRRARNRWRSSIRPAWRRWSSSTNTPSDNFFAEMLLKGIGPASAARGTTAAGAARRPRGARPDFGIHPRLERRLGPLAR